MYNHKAVYALRKLVGIKRQIEQLKAQEESLKQAIILELSKSNTDTLDVDEAKAFLREVVKYEFDIPKILKKTTVKEVSTVVKIVNTAFEKLVKFKPELAKLRQAFVTGKSLVIKIK